jgi:hypothetical protein
MTTHVQSAQSGDGKARGTIFITDYDFGDVEIERNIIEGAGFALVAAQCKSEDEVIGSPPTEPPRRPDGCYGLAPRPERACRNRRHYSRDGA